MADEGEGTFCKKSNSWYIRIPAKVKSDKDFPFEEGEKVRVLLTMTRDSEYYISVEKVWTQKRL